MDWIDLTHDGQVGSACKCGNEPMAVIKCGALFD
jgi:hypothetical protein